jgi:putative phosphoesterase
VRLGLVSDSHGLSDPALPRLFRGCDLILHAGDAVRAAVLAPLRALAPVRVVRGNNDHGAALGRLPETLLVELGPVTALLVHDLGRPARPHPPLQALLEATGPSLVVHGHSHRPGAVLVAGVLFVNPGSAGPRRFSLPRSAGLLHLWGRRARVELFDLAAPRRSLLAPPLEVELAGPAPARAARP